MHLPTRPRPFRRVDDRALLTLGLLVMLAGMALAVIGGAPAHATAAGPEPLQHAYTNRVVDSDDGAAMGEAPRAGRGATPRAAGP